MNKVSRSVLQEDGVRQAVRDAGLGSLLLSDDEMARSLARTLGERERGKSVWIFAYGSLIWNPLIEFAAARPARIFGHHRGFYLWSKINRGTPDRPGLVLGLDQGGSCNGIAYRLHRATVHDELTLLWRREMIVGTYVPRWVVAHDGRSCVRAIAFVVERSKPGYAGRLSDQSIVATALGASGHYGTCADYLLQTAASLRLHGIADARLSRLADQVALAQQGSGTY